MVASTVPQLLYVENAARTFLSHRLKQAVRVRELGFDVAVACPPDALQDRIRQAQIPVHSYTWARGVASAVQEAKAVAGLARLYRQVKPSIVHHFTPKLVIGGGVAARMARVPVAFVLHRQLARREGLRQPLFDLVTDAHFPAFSDIFSAASSICRCLD